jgi:hypothetical protein
MTSMSSGRFDVAAREGCGCLGPPRWRCEPCSARGQEHLACSRRCLERHWRGRHGQRLDGIGARARRLQTVLNEASAGNWEAFAAHRDRVRRLLCAAQRGEGLCVLGAGNGDDLDLPALVRAFGEVHLVDLDGAALERARGRLPGPLAARVLLHGDIDLTGLLETIELWGDDDEVLRRRAEAAAEEIAARLGRTFDVVLSSCVLSQLCTPFNRVLARRAPEWTAFMRNIGRSHFELVARLLRSGGTGVVLGDGYHGPTSQGALSWQTLDGRVARALREGVMRLRDPLFLAELAAAPPVRTLITAARLSEPWLWQVEGALMLVYAILLDRI